MPQYAIGDIHGCSKTFNELLNKIGLNDGDELYLLGDYIDRGPDSKGVIDTIFRLKESGYQVSCLRGNHEQMLLDALFIGDNQDLDNWVNNGGKETLQSFDFKNAKIIPPQYVAFFEALPFYIETEDLILVHAGLNFKVKNPLKDLESMLWIRNWYSLIDTEWLNNRTIIHGHTPITIEKIEFLFEKREKLGAVNLDGSAVFSLKGRHDCALCCLDWTNKKLYFQETIDKN